VHFSTDNMPDQKMTAVQRCKGPAVMKIGTITKTVLRTERPYGFIAVPGEARECYSTGCRTITLCATALCLNRKFGNGI